MAGELEILTALVSFFCPTPDAASACSEFISSHSQVLPPIGPMFYFLLFPLVFTILFVYILSSSVIHIEKAKWIQVLLGISVFIFIIINGWYPIMLFLSEFWFIFIVVILGMWYFIGKHRGESGGRGGGGHKGGMPGLGMEGGVLGAIMTKKQEHDELKLAESSLDMARDRLKAIDEGKEQRPADAMQQIEDSLASATGAINRLLADPVHMHKALQLEKERNRLMLDIKRRRARLLN